MKKLLFALLCILPSFIFSQQYEIGVLAGASVYSGDLSPDTYGEYFKTLKPAGGIFGRLYLNSKVALRLGISAGQLIGDDRNGSNSQRGLNFQSNLFEINFLGELQLLKITFPNSQYQGISSYVFGGLALYHFNPKTNYNGNLIELAPLGTEGQGLVGYPQTYGLSQFSIPLGIGFKIDLNNQWALGLEFGARKLFTDYLDDVGSAEIDYQTLRRTKGDLATILSIPSKGLTDEVFTYTRGGDKLDWYYITGVSLVYKFGNSVYSGGKFGKQPLGCPKI